MNHKIQNFQWAFLENPKRFSLPSFSDEDLKDSWVEYDEEDLEVPLREEGQVPLDLTLSKKEYYKIKSYQLILKKVPLGEDDLEDLIDYFHFRESKKGETLWDREIQCSFKAFNRYIKMVGFLTVTSLTPSSGGTLLEAKIMSSREVKEIKQAS